LHWRRETLPGVHELSCLQPSASCLRVSSSFDSHRTLPPDCATRRDLFISCRMQGTMTISLRDSAGHLRSVWTALTSNQLCHRAPFSLCSERSWTPNRRSDGQRIQRKLRATTEQTAEAPSSCTFLVPAHHLMTSSSVSEISNCSLRCRCATARACQRIVFAELRTLRVRDMLVVPPSKAVNFESSNKPSQV
jgi:hypothetical protein